jgi:hypothetical protein
MRLSKITGVIIVILTMLVGFTTAASADAPKFGIDCNQAPLGVEVTQPGPATAGNTTDITASLSADRKTLTYSDSIGFCGIWADGNWLKSVNDGLPYVSATPISQAFVVGYVHDSQHSYLDGSSCDNPFAIGDGPGGFVGSAASQMAMSHSTVPSGAGPWTSLTVTPNVDTLMCTFGAHLQNGGVVGDTDLSGGTVTASASNPMTAWTANAESVPALPDFSAPAKLTGLTGSAQTDGVHLSWNPSAAGDLYEYEVSRSGAFLADVKSGTTYVDGSAQAGQTYNYTVVAVDSSDNHSPASDPAVVQVPSGQQSCPTGTHGTPPSCAPNSCPPGLHVQDTQCVADCPSGTIGTTPPNCRPKDSDNDGIPDTQDHCLNTRGPAINQGCPLPSQIRLSVKVGSHISLTTLLKRGISGHLVLTGSLNADCPHSCRGSVTLILMRAKARLASVPPKVGGTHPSFSIKVKGKSSRQIHSGDKLSLVAVFGPDHFGRTTRKTVTIKVTVKK